MADFSVKVRAHELGKDLENLSKETTRELNQAVKDLSNAAYANMVARAQAGLGSTRAEFLKGLSLDQIGENTYLITLDGKFANALEEGWSPYDMRESLLKSKKTVQVGNRAGEPWVQQGQNGKYAHVPFQHRPFSKEAKTGDLNAAIRKMTTYNRQGRKQKLTSIFKDDFGNPLQGKVATIKDSDIPELANITKFQKIYENKETGKSTVQSIYMTWRTISENGDAWNHPGFEGIKAFLEAEKFVEQQIDIIINTLVD